MIKKKILFFYLIICFLNFTNLQSSIESSIIVKVDRKIVTNFDVKNKILSTLIIAGSEVNQENINKLKNQTLENLIFIKLKEIELEKFNFKVDNQRLNSNINLLAKNDLKKLKNDFNKYGLDYDLWKNEIEIELKWQQFIYSRYAKKIEIDIESINLELDKLVQTSFEYQEINLSEIEILQNENISNDELISKIFKEIDINGFETTALNFSIADSSSQKGSLGWINSNILSKKILNSLKNLKPGQVGKPIIQTNSILFLKLNSKRNTGKASSDREALKKKLIAQKQNDLFNLYSRSHLSKLRNNVLIQYK